MQSKLIGLFLFVSLQACTIVRVVDEDGDPVVGSSVKVHTLDPACNIKTWTMPATDSDGYSSIDGYANSANYVPSGAKVYVRTATTCHQRTQTYQKYCSGGSCKDYVLHTVVQGAGVPPVHPCESMLSTARSACLNGPILPSP